MSQPDLLAHVRRMDHLGLVAGVARKIRLVETGDNRWTDPASSPTRGDGGGSGSGPRAERVGIREPSPVSDPGLLRNQTGRDPDSGGGDGRAFERIHPGTGPGRSLRGGIVAALSEGRKPGRGAVGGDEVFPSVPPGLEQFHLDRRVSLQRGREGGRGGAGGHSDHARVFKRPSARFEAVCPEPDDPSQEPHSDLGRGSGGNTSDKTRFSPDDRDFFVADRGGEGPHALCRRQCSLHQGDDPDAFREDLLGHTSSRDRGTDSVPSLRDAA